MGFEPVSPERLHVGFEEPSAGPNLIEGDEGYYRAAKNLARGDHGSAGGLRARWHSRC